MICLPSISVLDRAQLPDTGPGKLDLGNQRGCHVPPNGPMSAADPIWGRQKIDVLSVTVLQLRIRWRFRYGNALPLGNCVALVAPPAHRFCGQLIHRPRKQDAL